ncbi:TrbC/VirB2 family protein [Myxococcus llanfairpwllgwyngyllgogerychwyrndrobwllllantysiliogogogochensis]|uniref:TrbC/VirB2 family protein n=1 Tax=Myxococcus llanfairpwllgwyngyllgogerychwyrndrobwllllantysiliogogogochensis TaxID=2590453 RepID=A0A540WWQ9_9BACT|nr:TrbC/VirB2 family protein [Myxococcus llanfairpwllgwyngyllgogerychwyrndrobwllllantysiliogogogochensis]TQF13433.1 TrbC/VirB2 family protein [Myxococcus llanfairpwllgwyngyllgogerychwyrndrobwllllantysiliogogogochensis]
MRLNRVPYVVLLVLLLVFCMLPADAFAASAGMPWEGPLEQISRSITGPFAKIAGGIVILFFGFSIAQSEGGGGWMKRAAQIGFGLSIAFNASAWGLPMLGFSGGALV